MKLTNNGKKSSALSCCPLGHPVASNIPETAVNNNSSLSNGSSASCNRNNAVEICLNEWIEGGVTEGYIKKKY